MSAIATSILGLLEHPEVLKKAQAQIDAVVKPGHLPDLEDEPSLPYITAIAKETLRWRDVTPIGRFNWLAWSSFLFYRSFYTGVPHSLTTEDEYKGYRIPAGAIIIPNAWYVYVVPCSPVDLIHEIFMLQGQCFMTRQSTPTHSLSTPTVSSRTALSTQTS